MIDRIEVTPDGEHWYPVEPSCRFIKAARAIKVESPLIAHVLPEENMPALRAAFAELIRAAEAAARPSGEVSLYEIREFVPAPRADALRAASIGLSPTELSEIYAAGAITRNEARAILAALPPAATTEKTPPNDAGCAHENHNVSPHTSMDLQEFMFRCNSCKRFWSTVDGETWHERFADAEGKLIEQPTDQTWRERPPLL